MKDLKDEFIRHLADLKRNNPGAIAKLRFSLDFPIGNYPPAFPYVEPFLRFTRDEPDALRLALYLTAGLFGVHPKMSTRSLANNCGRLISKQEHSILEKRFLSLLEAQTDQLALSLRRLVVALAKEDLGIDYYSLLKDLTLWMDPLAIEARGQIHFRWLQELYSAASFQSQYADYGLPENRSENVYGPVY